MTEVLKDEPSLASLSMTEAQSNRMASKFKAALKRYAVSTDAAVWSTETKEGIVSAFCATLAWLSSFDMPTKTGLVAAVLAMNAKVKYDTFAAGDAAEVTGSMIYRKAGKPGPAAMSIAGLWWMEGNPADDEIASFGSSEWDAETNSTAIEVYGWGVWSFHDSRAGKALFAMAYLPGLVYKFLFGQLKKGGVGTEITPCFDPEPVLNAVCVPAWLCRFDAEAINATTYLRRSWIFNERVDDYTLRQIIDGDGVPVAEYWPWWSDYTQQSEDTATQFVAKQRFG